METGDQALCTKWPPRLLHDPKRVQIALNPLRLWVPDPVTTMHSSTFTLNKNVTQSCISGHLGRGDKHRLPHEEGWGSFPRGRHYLLSLLPYYLGHSDQPMPPPSTLSYSFGEAENPTALPLGMLKSGNFSRSLQSRNKELLPTRLHNWGLSSLKGEAVFFGNLQS